ncbi:MAG TPA: hypothetical protein VK633_00915, partial [Verrucomicrobiae bacterium]|nr:hypothetical protein [Verrucomicrobiae bacterium]
MLEIERDLIRWSRGQWMALIGLLLVLQGTLFWTASRTPENVRTVYPREPLLTFSRAPGNNSEWVLLQDPSLFAGANPRGFSGSAWMIKPPWAPPAEVTLPQKTYLSLPDTIQNDSTEAARRVLPLAHSRPLPEPSKPEPGAMKSEEHSRLFVEGLSNRSLITSMEVPIQYASDAVRASVVQVMVDSEGVVLSSRLLTSSGSKTADLDALRIA